MSEASADEDESAPESDPYCAHWISLYDAEHEKQNIRCENCGESCRDHPILWGAWCPNAPEGTRDRERHTFKNEGWPADETTPRICKDT